VTPAGRHPEALAALVRSGVLDAELAALAWLLIEARVPVVVAGPAGSPRADVRDALIGLVPDTRIIRLAEGGEPTDWLPEAAELGWLPEAAERGWLPETAERGWHPERSALDAGRAPDASARDPLAVAGETVLVADLGPDGRSAAWGELTRLAIRALSTGYGMLAIAEGERLEDVLGGLAAPPVAALDDELSRLGLVLILGTGEGGVRVVAAHYLRPVARDAQGHVRRLPPAVIAVWDARAGRFEHFAWGILDELAGRLGVTPILLEREQARRMQRLAAGTGGRMPRPGSAGTGGRTPRPGSAGSV
jgi:hypothetical protein